MPSITLMDAPLAQKIKANDWLGIVIFFGGAICFTMAITFGGSVYAYDSGAEIALWVMAGVLLIAFVLSTIFHPFVPSEHRLYPAHFIKKLELNILQLQIFLAAGATMSTIYYVPLLFQFTRGDGALEAGVRLLPLDQHDRVLLHLQRRSHALHGYHMPWYIFGNAMTLVGAALMCEWLWRADGGSFM